MKFLITSVYCSLNNGEMALVTSIVTNLKRIFPEAEFTIFSSTPIDDFRRYKEYQLKVVPRYRSKIKILNLFQLLADFIFCLLSYLLDKTFGIKISTYNSKTNVTEYILSDVVIDAGADNFSDDYGIRFTIASIYNMLLGILLKKPVIILAQSIGPFNNFLTRFLAKFVLKRVSLITVREKITLNYLKSLGINKSINLTSDLAFLLKSKKTEKTEKLLKKASRENPVIGFNPSALIYKKAFPKIRNLREKYKKYVETMSKTIDYLVEEFDANVILIPHVLGPGEENDDRTIIRKIYNLTRNKHRIYLADDEYFPNELKEIIGQCDLFIGSRMHSTIASTSKHVPTIALSYSHKYEGIIGKTLGLEDYIIDVRKHNPEETFFLLKNRIDSLWKERNRIHRTLVKKTAEIEKLSSQNFRLISNLINNIKRNATKHAIERIVSTRLCTGCGTCAAACPNEALSMKKTSNGVYIPEIDHMKCKGCNLCVKVCPGHFVDFEKLNELIFKKVPNNLLLGNFEKLYIGHSTNHSLRWNASSGGLVSALLLFALEEGIIDGALVTKMNETKPLKPEPIIARTAEEVVIASKSKYCPVPANIALKEILEKEGKYAVVGLPCHIHGIRKLEMLNSKLRRRVVLHLGIFCSHTVNSQGTEFLLQKLGIEKKDVIEINYRGEGWPGEMSVTLKNGNKKYISSQKIWSAIFGSFFIPARCLTCCDLTNELSDISLGDAWLPELKKDKTGTSVIITRTETGERILQNAKAKGKILIQEINEAKVVESQKNQLFFKKKNLNARLKIQRLIRQNTPIYNTKKLKPNIMKYLTAGVPYFHIWISSKPFTIKLLKYIPFPLLILYNRIIGSIV